MFQRATAVLEISEGGLSAVLGRRGVAVWETLYEKDLPVHTVTEGRLTCPQGLSVALEEWMEKCRIRKGNSVILVLKNGLGMYRFEEFPLLSPIWLDRCFQSGLSGWFPVRDQEYRIDYKVIGQNAGRISVMLAAYPLEVLTDYVKVLVDLRLNPILIDLQASCLMDYMTYVDSGSFVAVSAHGIRQTALCFEEGKPFAIREFIVEDEEQLRKDLQKFYWHYQGSRIQKVYFVGTVSCEKIWTAVFAQSTIHMISPLHPVLQVVLWRHWQEKKRWRWQF